MPSRSARGDRIARLPGRCVGPARADERGFGLVELMVATLVFAIIAVGSASMLGSSLRTFSVSREKTTAEQLVGAKIEEIRQLDYSDVGTPDGNPSGVISESSQAVRNGLTFTMTTTVSYVDDPLPGGFRTYANYKKVVVSIRSSRSARLLATLETKIAPSGAPSASNGQIKVLVVDHGLLDQPLGGVTVQLQTGPSAPRNATTAADGSVVFPDLEPNPSSGAQRYYELRVTTPGWTTMSEDLPPAAAAKTQIGPGQLFSTSIRVYRPITINVSLRNTLGQPFTTSSTLTVSSTRGSSNFTVTNGAVSITQIAGELVVPNVDYTFSAASPGFQSNQLQAVVVPTGYPNQLVSSYSLTMSPALVNFPVRVYRQSNGNPLSGATVRIAGGPGGVNIVGTTNSSGLYSAQVPAGAGYTITVSRSGFTTRVISSSAPPAGGLLSVAMS